MKAALKTEDGRFELAEVDRPRLLREDWAVARVRVAGICGTDLRHWKKPDHDLACRIMGHELAGDVVEVGSGVHDLAPGDRVVIETVLGDGSCEWCRVGQYNLCPNLYPVRMETVSQAFAEYVAGPATKFYRLPDHVSFEEAALLDTFSVALHAMHLSGLRIGDKVVVIGAGPIGLGQLQLARLMGAEVLVTDVIDSALDLARTLGASAVVNGGDDDALEQVLASTGGRGADIVFECAGGEAMAKTLPQATKFARIGGKVVIVGGFDEGEIAIPLDWQRIQKGEIQLIPSASYASWDLQPEMQICLDLLAAGKLNARDMITHHFPIDAINEAFEAAEAKQQTAATFVAIAI